MPSTALAQAESNYQTLNQIKMKKTIIALYVLCLVVPFGVYLLVYHVFIDKVHKYEIEYSNGRYMYSDYTDTFQLTNNSIKYFDGKNEVVRYGTFSITNNKDYENGND